MAENYIAFLGKETICGGAAGAIGVMAGQPLDLIKVRMQLLPDLYANAFKCASDTMKNEGVKGFYRGACPPVLASFGVCALAFVGSSASMKVIAPDHKTGLGQKRESLGFKSMLSGCFGGFLTCLVSVPTDLIKCRMQIDQTRAKPLYGNSILTCARDILRTDGVLGFTKGASITVCREVPSWAAYFWAYDLFTSLLSSDSGQTRLVTMSAGFASGVCAWLPIYPLDVMKTHIQTNDTTHSKGQNWTTMKTLYAKHGMPIFFRGMGMCLLRAGGVNAVTFLFYEQFKDAWFA